MARRTGRRPGNPDTRESILAAAREAFAERGFDRASIRAIAHEARVDPALVHHYFGTKDKLFLAAMQAPVDPTGLLPQVLAEGPDGLGERLVRLLLSLWDSPAGVAGAALLRSAVNNDRMIRLIREFVTTQILRRAMSTLDLDPAEVPLRASLVASQMGGLALVRYILKIEPMASAPPEIVVASVGPTIQRYLTGALPDATTAALRDGVAAGAI